MGDKSENKPEYTLLLLLLYSNSPPPPPPPPFHAVHIYSMNSIYSCSVPSLLASPLYIELTLNKTIPKNTSVHTTVTFPVCDCT